MRRLLLCALIALVCVGCRSVKDVERVYVRDTIVQTQVENHIEYVHDSIYTERFHNEKQKGDTVFVHDIERVFVYRDAGKSDSVSNEKRESHNEQAEKTRTIVKTETKYVYWPAWVVIGAVVLASALVLVRRNKQKILNKLLPPWR